MAQKFTPYALTALPAASQRDPNGLYFIRTSTGFKMYLIADTPAKTAIEIELSGFVDTSNNQNVNGIKSFRDAITLLANTTGYPAALEHELKLVYRKNLPVHGGGAGLYIGANMQKTFMLDMQDLLQANWTQSIFRVVQLNFSESLTQLGFKRTFEISGRVPVVNPMPNSQHSIDILPLLPTWDGGHALKKGMNWDIVWTSGLTNNERYHSLKQMHAANAVWDLTIRVQSSGVFLLGRLQEGIELSIPMGAKLMIW